MNRPKGKCYSEFIIINLKTHNIDKLDVKDILEHNFRTKYAIGEHKLTKTNKLIFNTQTITYHQFFYLDLEQYFINDNKKIESEPLDLKKFTYKIEF